MRRLQDREGYENRRKLTPPLVSRTVPAVVNETWTQQVTRENPLVWWKLDEGIGSTTAEDASGNSRTGVITNSPALKQAGYFNANDAITFTGSSSQYVKRTGTTAGIVGGRTNFTVAIWLKSTGTSGFIFWEDETQLEITGTTILRGRVFNGSSSTTLTSAASTVTQGTYGFATLTYDGQFVNIYYNGAKIAAPGAQSSAAHNGTFITYIGRDDSGNYFTGSLDEFVVFPRCFSQQDVIKLYNNGLRGVYS